MIMLWHCTRAIERSTLNVLKEWWPSTLICLTKASTTSLSNSNQMKLPRKSFYWSTLSRTSTLLWMLLKISKRTKHCKPSRTSGRTSQTRIKIVLRPRQHWYLLEALLKQSEPYVETTWIKHLRSWDLPGIMRIAHLLEAFVSLITLQLRLELLKKNLV